MNVIVRYTYSSWVEGCGCCSNSESTIDVWVDDVLVVDDVYFPVVEDEMELRYSVHELYDGYDGFTIHPDTQYF